MDNVTIGMDLGDKNHVLYVLDHEGTVCYQGSILNKKEEMEKFFIQKSWHNFSPLGGDRYHCHLSYRYVACWSWQQGRIEIEVNYVGSREKAPY